MARPDLTTDAGVAAYRAELRQVGRNERLIGFGLILLALALLWGLPEAGVDARVAQTLGYGALAAGWGLMLWAILQRTRHHRRRLREEA